MSPSRSSEGGVPVADCSWGGSDTGRTSCGSEVGSSGTQQDRKTTLSSGREREETVRIREPQGSSDWPGPRRYVPRACLLETKDSGYLPKLWALGKRLWLFGGKTKSKPSGEQERAVPCAELAAGRRGQGLRLPFMQDFKKIALFCFRSKCSSFLQRPHSGA